MSEDSTSLLQAGTGQADITPPLGMYDGRLDERAQRVHAPITARVIYLDQPGGEGPVVLAMGDFGGMTHDTDRRVRRLIGEAIDVPVERVRLNASHNHTCIGGYRTVQDIYKAVGRTFQDIDWFENRVEDGFVSAAREAKVSRREATVAVGSAPVHGLMSNRSFVDDDGNTVVRFGTTDEKGRRAPRGLFDPDLHTLCFRDVATDKPIVTVVNIACHATSLANRGRLISPDFPGYAMSIIEEHTGGPTFFLQGAGGNVGPGVDSDGTIEGAITLARRIADAALLAIRGATPCPVAPLRLLARTQPVELLPDLPDETEARAAFEQCAAQPSPSVSELWRRAALLEVVSRHDEVSRCELFVLHHGNWCLAGLPGESFIESQLAIRGASSVPFTLVGAYYDTTLWYIPTWKATRDGGYEARGGWTYTVPGTSELLTHSIISRIQSLDECPVST